ncbi:MAG TPA: choice-of-anchor tandem repeat GloVer-containing protein [Rhizomicrobium sp.]|nr:choice-of-anchor tandem repeat GloVer-containing protein [Rhizomicrobium sp.]
MRRVALTVFGLSLLSSGPVSAGAETTLYSFCTQGGNSCTDGIQPVRSGVVSDSSGNLYGTTYTAGPNQGGEVFKLTPEGVLSVPLGFPDPYGGGGPIGGVVRDEAGNFYGATQDHVFKLAPDGSETLLHYFSGDGNHNYLLQSGVSLDRKGNVYGTSYLGGAGGDGILFRITPQTKLKVLHAFAGSDGAFPESPPIVDRDGNLFGVTSGGGSDNCVSNGCGVVYEVMKGGIYKVLYAFTGGNDGYNPVEGLALDRAGNLYGMALLGGVNGCGTVFKIPPDGSEITLHGFTYNDDFHDGCGPESQPVVDKKGNLYATTRAGGDLGGGTVFEITATGKEKILYAFGSAPDAAKPDGKLLMGSDGALYGTTLAGGTKGWGTVYKISLH